MWEPHTSTGGQIKGLPGENGNCQRADVQLGSGIDGGAPEKCVLRPLTFHPLSGLSQCLLRHSYVVRKGGFGDNKCFILVTSFLLNVLAWTFCCC